MLSNVRKSLHGGWRVAYEVDVVGNLVLQVVTCKSSGGAHTCRATAQWREGNFMTHRMFQDMSECIGTAKFRSTQDAVQKYHDECIAKAGGMDALVAKVKAKHGAEAEANMVSA